MYHFTPKRCASTSKIMYTTKAQALEGARSSYVQRGVQLWVYQCEYCHTWHLTSRPPVEDALGTAGSRSGSGRGNGHARSGSRRESRSWSGKPILSRKRGFKPRNH
ncbi:hypothetical protein ALMA_1534 [Alloscardovia macacae]|uniref:Uncharacterized protein n=2 Tax=Alloscardovia macacae TaxID=1160091 RepID=A0A261F043_9BIFI|nr:hypothetical protein ALMA_1534 [Alloscardovia macacae]